LQPPRPLGATPTAAVAGAGWLYDTGTGKIWFNDTGSPQLYPVLRSISRKLSQMISAASMTANESLGCWSLPFVLTSSLAAQRTLHDR